MSSLKIKVFEALDAAVEDGYPHVKIAKPMMVAIDLLDYISDLEGCTEEEIVPHIASWQEAQR